MSCGERLHYAASYRVEVALGTLLLSFIVPMKFGLHGSLYGIGILVCFVPAFLVVQLLLSIVSPPRYVRSDPTFPTLFRR